MSGSVLRLKRKLDEPVPEFLLVQKKQKTDGNEANSKKVLIFRRVNDLVESETDLIGFKRSFESNLDIFEVGDSFDLKRRRVGDCVDPADYYVASESHDLNSIRKSFAFVEDCGSVEGKEVDLDSLFSLVDENDWSEDTDWGEDQDSNAEDYYGNDYPDEDFY